MVEKNKYNDRTFLIPCYYLCIGIFLTISLVFVCFFSSLEANAQVIPKSQTRQKGVTYWQPSPFPGAESPVQSPIPMKTKDMEMLPQETPSQRAPIQYVPQTRSPYKEPSTIEKAYRLQYSNVIVRQLELLEHLDWNWPTGSPYTQDPRNPGSVSINQFGRQTYAPRPGETGVRPSGSYDKRPYQQRPTYGPGAAEPYTQQGVPRPETDAYYEDRPQTGIDLVEKFFTQFGYDFFQPKSFAPSSSMVVKENYLLQPGDYLRLNAWGAGADVQFYGVIDADGTISLPKLGVVPVAGIKYGDIGHVMSNEIKKYFPGANVDVSLVKPRSVEVYVAGQVKRPGLTVVPAFSTVLTALTEAGGPLKTGSLRNIVIYRQGKVHRVLDMYSLILRGNANDDIFLEDKDVIHVPYIGPTVAVVGAVPNPGIYEIKTNNIPVLRALALSGGALAQAQVKIYIRRFEKQQMLNVLDVNLDESKLRKVTIRNGDLLEIRYIGKTFPTSIRVTGHVWDPMEYSYEKGMKLSKVLPSAELLKPDAITDYCLIKRYNKEIAEFTWLRAPLMDMWQCGIDFELAPHDEVVILSKEEYGIKRSVYLSGAVWKAGEYEYTPGMTITDLIGLGGGLKNGASLKEVELSRQNIINDEAVLKHTKLDMSGGINNRLLQPYDTVMIPMVKGVGRINHVVITGEVRYPGKYACRDNERLSDLIDRAGGLLQTAYVYGAQYYSSRAQEIQQEAIDRMVEELELKFKSGVAEAGAEESSTATFRAAQERFVAKLRTIKAKGRVAIYLTELTGFRGSEKDFFVQNGDRLEIPNRPSFISVQGSVYSPNSYVYIEGTTLGEYLKWPAVPPRRRIQVIYMSIKRTGQS